MRLVIHELSVHAAIEEQLLYPLIDEAVQGGAVLAGHAVEEHQHVKDLLGWLDVADPTHAEYDAHVRRLLREVREHVEEEESDLFPELQRAVSATRLDQVGDAMLRARKIAPTRPHPNAPNAPPVNVVAGPLSAVVDAARDHLRPGGAADQLLEAAGWVQDTGARVGQAAVGQLARVTGLRGAAYAREQATARILARRGAATVGRLVGAQKAVVRSALSRRRTG